MRDLVIGLLTDIEHSDIADATVLYHRLTTLYAPDGSEDAVLLAKAREIGSLTLMAMTNRLDGHVDRALYAERKVDRLYSEIDA